MRKQRLHNNLKGKRKILGLEKEEALNRILWITRFGRGYGHAQDRQCDH
jgi:hypothetical protein